MSNTVNFKNSFHSETKTEPVALPSDSPAKLHYLNKTLESMPEVLTAQMISDYLHISRRRVYELFQIDPTVGGIPNFDIGFSKRVEKYDFIFWIEARKLQKQSKKSA